MTITSLYGGLHAWTVRQSNRRDNVKEQAFERSIAALIKAHAEDRSEFRTALADSHALLRAQSALHVEKTERLVDTIRGTVRDLLESSRGKDDRLYGLIESLSLALARSTVTQARANELLERFAPAVARNGIAG